MGEKGHVVLGGQQPAVKDYLEGCGRMRAHFLRIFIISESAMARRERQAERAAWCTQVSCLWQGL